VHFSKTYAWRLENLSGERPQSVNESRRTPCLCQLRLSSFSSTHSEHVHCIFITSYWREVIASSYIIFRPFGSHCFCSFMFEMPAPAMSGTEWRDLHNKHDEHYAELNAKHVSLALVNFEIFWFHYHSLTPLSCFFSGILPSPQQGALSGPYPTSTGVLSYSRCRS
jgi:hypothetical protein